MGVHWIEVLTQWVTRLLRVTRLLGVTRLSLATLPGSPSPDTLGVIAKPGLLYGPYRPWPGLQLPLSM